MVGVFGDVELMVVIGACSTEDVEVPTPVPAVDIFIIIGSAKVRIPLRMLLDRLELGKMQYAPPAPVADHCRIPTLCRFGNARWLLL